MSYQHALDRLREGYRLAMAAAEQIEHLELPPKERAQRDLAVMGLQTAANRCQAIGQTLTRELNAQRGTPPQEVTADD